MTATVAVAQFAPGEDKVANMAVIGDLVGEASAVGASVVILPEYSSFTASRFDDRVRTAAETLDGQFVTFLRWLASRHRVAVTAGMLEAAPGGDKVFNTVAAVDANGALVTAYRKMHLYDSFGFTESEQLTPGDPVEARILTVGGLRFGVQTCYDLRFPETSRFLVDAGAEVLVVPAQWMPGPGKGVQWSTLLAARAIENTVYVAAAGQCSPAGCGLSTILDPVGTTLAVAGDDTGLVVAEMSRARLDEVRSQNRSLEARRFQVTPKPDLV